MGIFEVALSVFSVFLGFFLSYTYEWVKGVKKERSITVVLLREIRKNIKSLEDELAIIDSFMSVELPDYIMPLGLEEVAERLEGNMDRESFNTCRIEIPLLGTVAAEAVFDFYESVQAHPKSLREIAHWAGNVRHGLVSDLVLDLIAKAKKAESAIV